MKKSLPLLICLILSVIVVSASAILENQSLSSEKINSPIENSLIAQSIVETIEAPKEVNKLYHQGNLVAYVNDLTQIDALLNDEYNQKYAESFPDSKIALGEDLYLATELTHQVMENVDDKIINYIKENDLFSIATNKVDFSTSEGVYATIYVKNVDDLNQARRDFLKNFVDEAALDLFSQKKSTPELQTYGKRDLSVSILETITVTKALASPSKIMTTKDEVFEYLCYGDNKERTYYTVKKGDTVEGVGSLAEGMLTAQQVLTINPNILKSTEQILEEGTQLNVTYFTSPISVIVEKELITKEEVFPEKTEYRDDPSLREGRTTTYQEEVIGSQNSKYIEKWVNGFLVSAEKVSSALISAPQREIIYRGTLVVPGVGSGNFRWPVDNYVITCGWYCYGEHTAVDVQNRYNRYGDVLAADRGVVAKTGYGALSGYYVVIDHNNGLQTQYNHMNKPAFVSAGFSVEKGEVIGQIGMTGKTTGPHVHFVIMENYTRVNPCKYMGC